MHLCSRTTGALILKLTFGYNVAEDQSGDPLVKIVEKAMKGFAQVLNRVHFW